MVVPMRALFEGDTMKQNSTTKSAVESAAAG